MRRLLLPFCMRLILALDVVAACYMGIVSDSHGICCDCPAYDWNTYMIRFSPASFDYLYAQAYGSCEG